MLIGTAELLFVLLLLKTLLSSDFVFFFSVKWNFLGQGERQLSLEIGDTVHIQEFCDGKSVSKTNRLIQIIHRERFS